MKIAQELRPLLWRDVVHDRKKKNDIRRLMPSFAILPHARSWKDRNARTERIRYGAPNRVGLYVDHRHPNVGAFVQNVVERVTVAPANVQDVSSLRDGVDDASRDDSIVPPHVHIVVPDNVE